MQETGKENNKRACGSGWRCLAQNDGKGILRGALVPWRGGRVRAQRRSRGGGIKAESARAAWRFRASQLVIFLGERQDLLALWPSGARQSAARSGRVKRPRVYPCLQAYVCLRRAGPANGPPALRDALKRAADRRAAAPSGALSQWRRVGMARAREGALGGFRGRSPLGEEGVPKTATRAEARGKAFPLTYKPLAKLLSVGKLRFHSRTLLF